MKNKMLVIFACMLLIAIVVLPVEGIINKNEVITYEHDVGVTGIISPTGGTLQIQEVEVAVKNYGNNSENDVPVNVVIEKDGGTVEYDETVLVDIGYGATVNVLFPDWMPSGNGSYTVTACTQLTGDEDPSNDCMSAEIIIGFKDEIEMYITGGLGATVIITNNGTETLTNLNWSFSIVKSLFNMGIEISGTNETGTITSLPPGASEKLKFMPNAVGIFKYCITLIDIPDCISYNDMAQLFIVLIDIPDCFFIE